jgi:hypothetical protein
VATPTPLGLTDSVELSEMYGKRVCVPMRRATSWSSEMLFLNPGRPTPGAPVRNAMSAPCPPAESMPGCDRPEKTVKSLRKSLSTSRYFEGL